MTVPVLNEPWISPSMCSTGDILLVVNIMCTVHIACCCYMYMYEHTFSVFCIQCIWMYNSWIIYVLILDVLHSDVWLFVCLFVCLLVVVFVCLLFCFDLMCAFLAMSNFPLCTVLNFIELLSKPKILLDTSLPKAEMIRTPVTHCTSGQFGW